MRDGVGEAADEEGQIAAPQPQAAAEADEERSPRPQPRVRTCVASLADSHAFGPLVAAEAQQRDFFRAARRAYLGDGAAYNWWIQRAYFPDFEPITDFLHMVCYLYQGAWAVLSKDDRLARFFAQRPGNPFRRRKTS
jgi:hypothetical protein